MVSLFQKGVISYTPIFPLRHKTPFVPKDEWLVYDNVEFSSESQPLELIPLVPEGLPESYALDILHVIKTATLRGDTTDVFRWRTPVPATFQEEILGDPAFVEILNDDKIKEVFFLGTIYKRQSDYAVVGAQIHRNDGENVCVLKVHPIFGRFAHDLGFEQTVFRAGSYGLFTRGLPGSIQRELLSGVNYLPM